MAINRQTKQHIMVRLLKILLFYRIFCFQKAMRSNFKVFFSLDKIHKNGQIDWDEYYHYFTRTRMGLEDGDIRRLETDPRSVSREVREALAEVKAAWSEAARTNPDAVNIDEFLGLEHPESSHTLLTQRVEVLIKMKIIFLAPSGAQVVTMSVRHRVFDIHLSRRSTSD